MIYYQSLNNNIRCLKILLEKSLKIKISEIIYSNGFLKMYNFSISFLKIPQISIWILIIMFYLLVDQISVYYYTPAISIIAIMNCRIFFPELRAQEVKKFFSTTQSHSQTSLQNANKINKEKYVVIQVYLDSRNFT